VPLRTGACTAHPGGERELDPADAAVVVVSRSIDFGSSPPSCLLYYAAGKGETSRWLLRGGGKERHRALLAPDPVTYLNKTYQYATEERVE